MNVLFQDTQHLAEIGFQLLFYATPIMYRTEQLGDNTLARLVSRNPMVAWLNLIRDHIATAISIEPEDLDLTPFNQRGGLGKAHQLFGEQLPKLLDELNEALAA